MDKLPVAIGIIGVGMSLLSAIVAYAVYHGMSKQWRETATTTMQEHDNQLKEHAKSLSTIGSGMDRLAQQMADHNDRDDERFGRIDEYMAETRQDIKEILRSVKR